MKDYTGYPLFYDIFNEKLSITYGVDFSLTKILGHQETEKL